LGRVINKGSPEVTDFTPEGVWQVRDVSAFSQ
jgi:hypothetical protein